MMHRLFNPHDKPELYYSTDVATGFTRQISKIEYDARILVQKKAGEDIDAYLYAALEEVQKVAT